MATKPQNVDEYSFLTKAPEPGSNILLIMKKRRYFLGSNEFSGFTIDMLYNGQFINYCGTKRIEIGCSFEEFIEKLN